MTHPNNMSSWDDIRCQRNHSHHELSHLSVNLRKGHRYHDFSQVPPSICRRFEMLVWDPKTYPVDGGPYCPAHDTVSVTIASTHIWEPRETILALHVFSTAPSNSVFYDMGSQLGWFSLLAASHNLRVEAFEADSENVRALVASAHLNGWNDRISVEWVRIGEGFDLEGLKDSRIRLAKLDLEGAERHAVDALWGRISLGLVDHLLIEVSPTFDTYYPDMVAEIMDAGYDAFLLPPKRIPPYSLDTPADLREFQIPRRIAKDIVATWTQEDVWFKHQGASW